ncbi:hypothetical protein, partial [Roseibium sp. MMSF_3544]|uniref:hypothetical protein n=1 Tax=Roseibium sp. MMSF_3544 TaxID=3046723 RepID=UPI00273CF8FF
PAPAAGAPAETSVISPNGSKLAPEGYARRPGTFRRKRESKLRARFTFAHNTLKYNDFTQITLSPNSSSGGKLCRSGKACLPRMRDDWLLEDISV